MGASQSLQPCSAIAPGTLADNSCYTIAENGDRILWPQICPGPNATDVFPLHSLQPAAPSGRAAYDFLSGCGMGDLATLNISWTDDSGSGDFLAPPSAPLDSENLERYCAPGQSPNYGLLPFYFILVVYVFYGLAHVCEEFLVPALNVLCERFNIPEDVAGATLMAAGCNAPELFASIMGVFIDHTTVGAGTVVGSAPFNLLCICGAASLAIGGTLHLDASLLVRETFFLCLAILLLVSVLNDDRVIWWEALLLVLLYVGYVFACVYTSQIVALLYWCVSKGRRGATAPSSTMGSLDDPLAIEVELRPRGRLTAAREALASSLSSSLSRSLNDPDVIPPGRSPRSSAMLVRAFVPTADGACAAGASSSSSCASPAYGGPAVPWGDSPGDVASFPMDRPMELGSGPTHRLQHMGRRLPGVKAGGGTALALHDSLDVSACRSSIRPSSSSMAGSASWDALVEDCRRRCAVYRVQIGAPTWEADGSPSCDLSAASASSCDLQPLRANRRSSNGGGGSSPAAFTTPTRSRSRSNSLTGWEGSGLGGIASSRSHVEGILHKKSRFYSSLRMSSRTWQRRYFVLDDDPIAPLRYMRLDPATGRHPLTQKHVRIDLHHVGAIERVSEREIHLIYSKGKRRRQVLRCGAEAEADPWVAQRWFDEIVVKTDEVRKQPPPDESASGGVGVGVGEEEEDHPPWYTPPPKGLTLNRILFCLALPMKAAIHLSIPPVLGKYYPLVLPPIRCEKFYPLSLLLAVVWLALLAILMTVSLDHIGCACKIPSSVMGLTLGAIGTSFPNLYASILTAQAGQAGMSICQAFGANTFNLCIGLGLVWLLEAIVGQCAFGNLESPVYASCGGCYMPSGFVHACPRLDGPAHRPAPQSGSLLGNSSVTLLCVALIVVTVCCSRCHIPKWSAAGFFIVYFLYVLYQLLVSWGDPAPMPAWLCWPDWWCV